MILKSGPMEVQMVRRRTKFVFHPRELGRDWLINFTKLVEQPISREYKYQNREVVTLHPGHDNAELDVSEAAQQTNNIFLRTL